MTDSDIGHSKGIPKLVTEQDAINAIARIFLYHHGTGVEISGALVKREKGLNQLRVVHDFDKDIWTVTLVRPISSNTSDPLDRL